MAETKTRTATIRQLDPMTPDDLSDQDLLLIYDVDQRDDHDPKAAARAKKFTVKDFKEGLQHGHRIVDGLQYEIEQRSIGNTLKIKAIDKLDSYASDRHDGIISSETYNQIQDNEDEIEDLKTKDTFYHSVQGSEEEWLPIKQITTSENSSIVLNFDKENGNKLIIDSLYDGNNQQNAFTRIYAEDQNGSINVNANTATSELRIKGQGSIGIKQNETSPANEIVFYLQAGDTGADVKIKTPDDPEGSNFINRLATIMQGEGISFEKEGTQGLKINAIDTSIKIIPCLVDQENNQNTEHDLSRYINVDLNTQKIIPVYFEQTPSVNEQFYDPDNNYLHETGMSFIVNGENSYPIYHNDHPYYPSQKLIKHFGLFLFYNQNGISRFYLIGSDGQGKNAESEDSSSSPTVIINVDPGQIETKNNCDYRTIKFKDQGDNVYASVQVLTDIHKDEENGVAGLDENGKISNNKLNIFTDSEAAEPKINKVYIPDDIAEKNEAYIINYKDDIGITIPDGAMAFDISYSGSSGGGGTGGEGSSAIVGVCTTAGNDSNKVINLNSDPSIGTGTFLAIRFNSTFTTTSATLTINRNSLNSISGNIYYEGNEVFPIELISENDLVLFIVNRNAGTYQFEILSIDETIKTGIKNIYTNYYDILNNEQEFSTEENPYSLLQLRDGTTFQLPRTLFEDTPLGYRIKKEYFPESLSLETIDTQGIATNVYSLTEGRGINFTYSQENVTIESDISLPTTVPQEDRWRYVLNGNGSFIDIFDEDESPFLQGESYFLTNTNVLETIMEAIYPPGSYYETSASNFNPSNMGFPGADDSQWELVSSTNNIYRWHRMGAPRD